MARNGSDTSTRLTVLETQFETISTDIVKIEEKMDANYATLHSRISDMRDDFHKSLEDKHEKVMTKLDQQVATSTAQHAEFSEKMQSLEKWRWMLVGAAIVLGYVIAHVKLEKLF